MIELIKGDCLVEMLKIEDKSIDVIICDLPFNTTMNKWDVLIPFDKLWEQYKRIIKDSGAIVLFGSQPFTSELVMSNKKWFKYQWVWEKSKASNFLNAKFQPLKAHEDIIIFGNGKVNYYPQKTRGKSFNKGIRKNDNGVITESYNKVNEFEIVNESGDRYPRSIQYFNTAEREGKLHPTQKPIALLEYLVKTYTKEGETVLDNTFGSCTTGVACVNLNRNFIGIEMDEKYFEIGQQRIEEAKNNIIK